MKNIVRSLSTQSGLTIFSKSEFNSVSNHSVLNYPINKNKENKLLHFFIDNRSMPTKGRLLMDYNPCPKIGGAFKYPFDFKCHLQPLCSDEGEFSIFLPADKKTYTLNIKDLCIKFYKDFWCSVNQNELNQAIENYKRAIEEIIKNDLGDEYQLTKNGIPVNKNAIDSKINQFKIQIDKLATILKTNHKFSWFKENKDSCICGGELPTYCCHPDIDHAKCYCPNGIPKNLCKPCDTKNKDCFPCQWYVKCCRPDKKQMQFHDWGSRIFHLLDEGPTPGTPPCCVGTPDTKKTIVINDIKFDLETTEPLGECPEPLIERCAVGVMF